MPEFRENILPFYPIIIRKKASKMVGGE